MSSNNYGTSTSLLTFLDQVDLIETLTLVSLVELLSKVVITNASSVHNRPRRQNILYA